MDSNPDKLHAALLTLLRSGLWEKDIDNLSCFPLSDEEWKAVFRIACRQTVTGLVYQGLQYLPDGMLPPEPVLIRWTAEVDAIERMNLKVNRSLSELYALLVSHDLNPILLKGQGVAQFYEKPLLRECGDIDLYFNNERTFSIVTAYVRWCRIPVYKKPDKSLFYLWQGIEVEHHKRLFDLYNPFLQCYADRLECEKGYVQQVIHSQSGLRITIPSPFLNLLMLDLHILKHALGWGIGLRQLCDMARACYKLHEEINTEEMEKVCTELGLSRWNPLLHAFLKEQLGLPVSCLPYGTVAPDAGVLLDIIWRSGNFGYQLSGRNDSGRPAWKRKLRTADAVRQNLNFARRYAPKESFWLVCDLLKGQF